MVELGTLGQMQLAERDEEVLVAALAGGEGTCSRPSPEPGGH